MTEARLDLCVVGRDQTALGGMQLCHCRLLCSCQSDRVRLRRRRRRLEQRFCAASLRKL